jgi:hypothetical protein
VDISQFSVRRAVKNNNIPTLLFKEIFNVFRPKTSYDLINDPNSSVIDHDPETISQVYH